MPTEVEIWQRTIGQLEDFFQIQDDWDGEGSSRPDPANVTTAIRWVEGAWAIGFPPPTQVVPGGAGELQLVWLKGDLRVEADFAEPGKVEWLLTRAKR